MCEDRERLIGFVYGESSPDEKRVIEEHLATCHDCREEIRGLRGVRQDLLAWDVPAMAPTWRPVAAEPPPPSLWRQVPAWALAAAAGVMLMIGAAGGAATYALLPQRTAVVAAAPQALPALPASVTAPAAAVDVAAIEARVMERLRAELDARERLVTAQATTARPSTDTSDLARRVNVLTARQDELSNLLLGLANETIGISTKQSVLERDNRQFVSFMLGDGSRIPGGR